MSTGTVISRVIVPSQDIVLGTYYMTRGITGRRGEGKSFANTGEVRVAYDAGEVELHSKIQVRMQGKRYQTTVGRVLLWEIIPKVDILELRHLARHHAVACEQLLCRRRAPERIRGPSVCPRLHQRPTPLGGGRCLAARTEGAQPRPGLDPGTA
jgi:hypothetical protein